jgi:ketosteroid isomerase-like protein
MFTNRWAAAGACLIALAGMGTAVAAPASHARIRSLMAAMDAAANLHDADAFLKPFVHGPQLVYVINGRVIRGWDALHAQQLKWWRHGKSDVRYAHTAPTRFIDLAPGVVVTTELLDSRRTGEDGNPQTGNFVVTNVWKRDAGRWRIVYAHESWVR